MAAVTSKSCDGCAAIAATLKDAIKALTGGMVERLVQSEINAFLQGVDIGRQFAQQVQAAYGRPPIPQVEAQYPDDPPPDDDVVIVGRNGMVGDQSPAE
jgi:hypothetical protein